MSSLNFNDLLDNEDVDDIFSLEEEIASGAFGTVYKVIFLPEYFMEYVKVTIKLFFQREHIFPQTEQLR